MSNKLAEMFKTQKSLTEWLEDIKHKDVEAIRREDNDKRERLKVLHEIIGLPFDKPVQFKSSELTDKNKKFQTYLEEHGEELCALRLIPTVDGLPKLRMRGKSVKDTYLWYKEQSIDANKYRADFVPHPPDNIWATIFVINKHGIQGEIIAGGHHQLTQGFHQTATPIAFKYDFKDWATHPKDAGAIKHLKKLEKYLHVPSKVAQKQLKKELDATFVNDYLEGYFETTDSSIGTWFIDYSPSLGKMYGDFEISFPAETAHLSGMVGSQGKAQGPVCVVKNLDIDGDGFVDGSILVCEVTTPDYVPFMRRAGAIVTDQGGILSHAAIVARELGVPCIVGTQHATVTLKNGQLVTVNAIEGVVF